MNLHILGALCFSAHLFPNNLIFNNIDFRYSFAFNRYLHFFSITFPDSRFVVLGQRAEKRARPVILSPLAGCSGGLRPPSLIGDRRYNLARTA